MPGHSLFQGLYLVEGYQFPLDPQMYIQKSVCEREQRPFPEQGGPGAERGRNLRAAGRNPHPGADRQLVCQQAHLEGCRGRGCDLSDGLKANNKLPRAGSNYGR